MKSLGQELTGWDLAPGLMNVKLQWYRVKDGQVDLPLGAQIIEVRFEDKIGMGGDEQPVAVLVQVNEMPSE